MSSICLVAVIEGNSNNMNYRIYNEPRLYETEAIKCFRSWRTNGGHLKNIDIYCLCVSDNAPSEQCIMTMKEMNVTYIHQPHDITKTFQNGFWNKPLGCMYAEKNFHHDYIIHIDLDMYLLRPLTVDPFRNSCLIYDDMDCEHERKFNNNIKFKSNPFNTCFMTSRVKDQMFSNWFDILTQQNINYNDYFTEIEHDKIEEGAFDILACKYHDITPISDIMFGESYTDINKMNTTNNICFHHYHMNSLTKYNRHKDRGAYEKTR